jgi:hypothetical protein
MPTNTCASGTDATMNSVAPGTQLSSMSQCGPNSRPRTMPSPGRKIASKSSLSLSNVVSVRQATPALQPA